MGKWLNRGPATSLDALAMEQVAKVIVDGNDGTSCRLTVKKVARRRSNDCPLSAIVVGRGACLCLAIRAIQVCNLARA